jgi:hypothetical protein
MTRFGRSIYFSPPTERWDAGPLAYEDCVMGRDEVHIPLLMVNEHKLVTHW